MSEFQKEKVLNPTVVKLGLVSFLTDVASDMLYPVTPIFLTSVLGASMTSVGLIEGFADATASLLKLFAGVWSDRIGERKPFVVIGYILAALSKPLTGVSTSWLQVLGVRALDRVGKGLRTAPRDAMLAEAVSERARGAVFGWHRAMDSAGATTGPLLALLYLSLRPNDLREIYFWALIPGLFSVALMISVKEKRVAPAPASNGLGDWKFLPVHFWKYLFVWGVFSLANSSDVFLLMHARESGLPMTSVVLLYCLYNAVYSFLSPFLGHASDRIGRRILLIGGLLAFSLVYTAFALAREAWHFWVLFVFYGLYMAATDGAGKALALDLVPSNRKGTALGAFGMVTGFSSLFASVAAGVLWDHVSHGAPFLFGAAGALVSVILLAFFH